MLFVEKWKRCFYLIETSQCFLFGLSSVAGKKTKADENHNISVLLFASLSSSHSPTHNVHLTPRHKPPVFTMNPSASSWAPPASTQSDKDEAAQIVAKAQQDAADRERDAAKVKSGGLSKEELQVSKPQPPPKTHNYLHYYER